MDEILKSLKDMKDKEFNQTMESLLKNMNFEILSMKHDSEGLEAEAKLHTPTGDELYLIDIKRPGRPIQPEDLQGLVGKKKDEQEMRAIYLTTDSMSEEAEGYAKSLGVFVRDGNGLVEEVKRYDLARPIVQKKRREEKREEISSGKDKSKPKKKLERFLPSVAELEELMRNVYALVDEIQVLRREVEESLRKAFARFALAKAQRDPGSTEIATSLPSVKLTVEAGTRRILNVKAPTFKPKLEGDIRCYGFAETSAELDFALARINQVLEKMVLLAQ